MNCLKCGINISDTIEEGVNGTDFFSCEECHLGFNVLTSKLDGE